VLHLREIVGVVIPTVQHEAARARNVLAPS